MLLASRFSNRREQFCKKLDATFSTYQDNESIVAVEVGVTQIVGRDLRNTV